MNATTKYLGDQETAELVDEVLKKHGLTWEDIPANIQFAIIDIYTELCNDVAYVADAVIYENRYEDGYDDGYKDGYLDGEEDGYNKGYELGYDEAEVTVAELPDA
jgi:hypothetical protein